MPSTSPIRLFAADHGPHEGVPGPLRSGLENWAVHNLACVPVDDLYDNLEVNDQQDREQRMGVLFAKARVAINPGWSRTLLTTAVDLIAPSSVGGAISQQNDDAFLEIVNMHLQCYGGGAQELAELLDSAGSVWTVVDSPPRLQRRVPDEQRLQHERAAAPADVASDHLREAWIKARSWRDDPSDAWDHAIKAVEALLHTIVSPKNDQATLGTMLRDLEVKPDKWILTLESSSNDVSGVQALTGMLRLMWPNPDRHASGRSRPPTHSEAEQVVGLAVLVVSWLRDGVLQKTTTPETTASP